MTEARAPRISVISAFFNAETYLAETIESVLDQSFEDFELLLVDDGSTDGSVAIANNYLGRSPDRIICLQHEGRSNLGTCASRNLALRKSRGEYIAFIDADDVWRPSKLEDQAALLDRMPEVDAVCGAVNFWSSYSGGQDRMVPTGHVQNRPIGPIEALRKIYPLGKADPPCPSDLMMRRSIVEKIGGFEEAFVGPLQLYEDQAFLAKFFLEGTIYCADEIWLDYRVHDQSCTSRVVREGLGPEMRRQCLEWFCQYLSQTRHRYNPIVRWTLLRAMRPYRFPLLSQAGRVARRRLRLGPEGVAHV